MNFYWEMWPHLHSPSRVHWGELSPEQWKFMYAVNMNSRLKFVQVAYRHIDAFLPRDNGALAGIWITLAPPQYILDVEQASEFPVRRLQKWVQHYLRGLDYVGMVEIGPFEVHINRRKRMHLFSWHAHILARLTPLDQFARLLNDIETRFPPFFPGMTTTHHIPLRPRALRKKVYYMMKTPWKMTRFALVPRTRVNRQTGEIEEKYTRKDRLGPGQISRVYDVMGRRTLDELLFGGGTGVAVVRAIRDEALANLKDWERYGWAPSS